MKRQFFDRVHNHLMKPQVNVFGKELPAWGLFFSASVVIAVGSVIPLAIIARLPIAPLLIASTCGVASLFVLAFATKIVTGDEVYNFHHYLFIVMLFTGVALSLLGQPVLRNLDVIILGIGVSYGCGRYACLRGGCCYGRPFNWGVCYPSEYVQHGFPMGLVGVKLFPSQFVESLWMWLSITVGIICLRSEPGAALAWFIVLYSVGRFFSDFYRLEAGFCVRGLSEAQIASIVMTCVVFGAEQMTWLPAQPIHGAAVLLLIIIGIPRLLSKSDYKQLFTTYHVIEIANAVKRADNNRTTFTQQTSGFDARDLPVQRTSLGLLISAGTICTTTSGSLIHYCISREGTLRDSTAQGLAKLISIIHGRPGAGSLIKRDRAFHIIISGSSETRQQNKLQARVE
jgi:hypothetical protein